MDFIFILLVVYLVQMATCSLIHVFMCNRMSRNGYDFLYMTFLPWVTIKLINNKDSLQ